MTNKEPQEGKETLVKRAGIVSGRVLRREYGKLAVITFRFILPEDHRPSFTNRLVRFRCGRVIFPLFLTENSFSVLLDGAFLYTPFKGGVYFSTENRHSLYSTMKMDLLSVWALHATERSYTGFKLWFYRCFGRRQGHILCDSRNRSRTQNSYLKSIIMQSHVDYIMLQDYIIYSIMN